MKRTFFGFICLTSTLTATTYTVTESTDSSVGAGGASGELRYVLNQILNYQAENHESPTSWDIVFTVSSVTLNNILPMINFQCSRQLLSNFRGHRHHLRDN